MQLLHIDSSIQGAASVSRQISAAMVDHYRTRHGNVDVRYRDLVAEPLPHITLPRFGTDAAEAILTEFLAADVLILGAPMYNFGLASQLKAWFDHILVAGRTFQYADGAVKGLAASKQAIVAVSRGGLYAEGPAQAMEHAESHLRAMLTFIGIDRPHIIVTEGVALGDAQRDAAVAAALAQVRAIDEVMAMAG